MLLQKSKCVCVGVDHGSDSLQIHSFHHPYIESNRYIFIRVVISNQLKCLSNTTFRQFTTALFRYKVLNDYSDTIQKMLSMRSSRMATEHV